MLLAVEGQLHAEAETVLQAVLEKHMQPGEYLLYSLSLSLSLSLDEYVLLAVEGQLHAEAETAPQAVLEKHI